MPGDTKPLEEVEPGVGPGRIITLHHPMLLNDAVQKLKIHLNLPYLRLALGVNVDQGTIK